MAFFEKKKTIDKRSIEPNDLTPSTSQEFTLRGWTYYNHEDYPMAREDFSNALQLEPYDIDIEYALALTLKSLGKRNEALQHFEKIRTALDNLHDRSRSLILKRLVLGHIAQLQEEVKTETR